MAQHSTFDIQRSEHPRTAAERTAILENPGFGRYVTDHMVVIDYEEGKGWVITPNPQILTMNLLEGQPRLIDETLKIVEWNVRFDILPEVQVYRKDTNQVYPITDFDTRGLIRDGAIHGTLRTQFTNEWRPVQFIPENSLS